MESQFLPDARAQPDPAADGPVGTRRHIALRQVRLARNDKPFARIPDFTATGGDVVALVGPSGSGKTTALLALAAIRPPCSGAIKIGDQHPWTLSARARDRFRGRHIGLVFQTFHLVDALSVSENILLAGRCAGLAPDPEQLKKLLDRLGLSAIRDRRADRISHGQAQRVAVARALLNRPAVIIADEPTSALDDANAKSLLSLLKECAAAENAALIIATHDRRVLDSVPAIVTMETI